MDARVVQLDKHARRLKPAVSRSVPSPQLPRQQHHLPFRHQVVVASGLVLTRSTLDAVPLSAAASVELHLWCNQERH